MFVCWIYSYCIARLRFTALRGVFGKTGLKRPDDLLSLQSLRRITIRQLFSIFKFDAWLYLFYSLAYLPCPKLQLSSTDSSPQSNCERSQPRIFPYYELRSGSRPLLFWRTSGQLTKLLDFPTTTFLSLLRLSLSFSFTLLLSLSFAKTT
jgi:hypothetical protein